MIPEAIVEEVRARADIVEFVGEHVALKRAGKEYRALCPFHQEKTPSFYVAPAKGFYKCFGCGESGDVFTFLMKRLGLGFHEAVRHVARRVGVEVPDVGPARQEDEAHRALYEAVAFAADYYQAQLAGPAGERARRYLEERGISREAAERFRLGYAPAEWRALREAARKHGIEDAVLVAAGLVKESESAEDDGGAGGQGRPREPYDRFRDRLIFPITDPGGRVIAFGGRVIGRVGEGVPKYLNSPETPIYHKGRTLYGLHWARAAIRREGVALVVEGYMDFVSLAARGVENAVAGLGTAMTAEQAELLARYTRKALLLYDSDTAGLRATFRTADALLRAGIHPLVVTLPPGEDPDSLVRKAGVEGLRPYLDAALDVLERKLQILEERGYFEDIEGVRKALDRLLPTLRAAADPALRDIYVARVAERTGVRRETLERELVPDRGRAWWPASPSRGSRMPTSAPPAPSRRGGVVAPGLAGQRKLLLLLLRDESRIPQAAELLTPDDFSDPVYRELFEALVREGGLRGRGPLALEVGPAARQRLEDLLADPEELIDGDGIFRDSVADIQAGRIFRRLDELDRQIQLAQERGDESEQRRLLVEKHGLMAELQRLGSQVERLFQKRGARGRPGTQARDG